LANGAFARSPYNTTLHDIWEWIQNIAKGAALMTGTTMDISGIGSYANIIPNDPLAAVAQRNLQEVGGYKMTADEEKFALELQKTFKMDTPPSLASTNEVEPLRKFDPNEPAASTDVGDVSWHVPTIGFSAATFVPGSAAHTWQATAAAGMSIGQKGMVVAPRPSPSPDSTCSPIRRWCRPPKPTSPKRSRARATTPPSPPTRSLR